MPGPAYVPGSPPPPDPRRHRLLRGLGVLIILAGLLCLSIGAISSFILALLIGGGLILTDSPRLRARFTHIVSTLMRPSSSTRPWATSRDRSDLQAPAGPRSVAELHSQSLDTGSGAYLGITPRGEWMCAPPQAAVLVLAGPRAGKTSCVVIPALAAHPGPAIATSTKSELLHATLGARQALGTCWYLDLTGQGHPPGTQPLRWSPVTRAIDWSAAQSTAEQMTGAADTDVGSSHWTDRAASLIAAQLHAAALGGLGMRDVLAWTLRQDSDSPLAELEPASLAHDVLTGITRTADRERSGIYSTASRVLRAYSNETALAAATDPTLDPERFIQSRDTIYIAAPAQDQRLLAPLVVGLLSDIRHAAYRHHHNHPQPGRPPLLLMLDECANVAPIPDLPAMLSEAGGQGIHTVVVFQDMSQARRRWPREADGMLSLFGARVILAGVADPKTLSQLSLLCGQWDRPVQTSGYQQSGELNLIGRATRAPTHSDSWTTRREPRLPADEIAQLRQGQALIMIGPDWELVPTLPWDRHPNFNHLGQAGSSAPAG
jgi:type IV secretion system protein VirD4